eukprot:3349325-Alexandrium_andersonii.AAC.1
MFLHPNDFIAQGSRRARSRLGKLQFRAWAPTASLSWTSCPTPSLGPKVRQRNLPGNKTAWASDIPGRLVRPGRRATSKSRPLKVGLLGSEVDVFDLRDQLFDPR